MKSKSGLTYEALGLAAAALGLACRGGFHPSTDDKLPLPADGRAPGTLVLLGFTGGDQWPIFAASAEYRDGKPDPLDRWSQRVVMELAHAVGGTAVFPFTGPPWWPFQRWAQRAEGLAVSPLGILIHPLYGLWHAYRGALLIPDYMEVPTPLTVPSPCEACSAKPCLSICPARAITTAAFLADACAALLHEYRGQACMSGGCLARRACPVAAEHRYCDAQAAFHVQAFGRARC